MNKLAIWSHGGETRRMGVQTRHCVGIDESTLPKREGAMRALDHETMLPVQTNRRFVVHEHDEFQPQEVQPVIREREGVLQQDRSDALPRPGVVHGHTKRGGMAASRPVGRMDAQVADDGPIRHRDERPNIWL